MSGKLVVFIATSLDGFIAGEDDDLDWLSGRDGVEDTFTPFMKGVGALLMGRRTYDVACGFEGDWPYGDTPVLVATSRPFEPRESPASWPAAAARTPPRTRLSALHPARTRVWS